MTPSLMPRIRIGELPVILLLIPLLMMLSGCPAESRSDDRLRQDLEALKKEVAALKDQVNKLEAAQKLILAQLGTESPPAAGTAAPAPPGPAGPPLSSEPLSVSQLIKEKDRYLGFRIAVKGPVGPVLVHHKSLMLKAPEGMVEVLLGKLPDQQMVERVMAAAIAGPITVTGMVRQSARGGTQLQITAEELEF
ncbi:MAG: hypothetical protein FJ134_07060 [Deltaproteobacteria bacterium]|nr:hypothetical protein [Deltaproteobacteria bacterium]